MLGHVFLSKQPGTSTYIGVAAFQALLSAGVSSGALFLYHLSLSAALSQTCNPGTLLQFVFL